MSAPIYKISDRAPEFPCWLYEPHGLFPWRHYAEPAHDFGLKTHWTHSDTMPTVTPEEKTKAGVICHAEGDRCHGCNHYKDPVKNPVCRYATQPSADVQRVAEEIARLDSIQLLYPSGKSRVDIVAILTRFAAELTAQKDAEIARLKEDREILREVGIRATQRAEKAEAERADYHNKARELGNHLAAAQEDIRRLDWLELHGWSSSYGECSRTVIDQAMQEGRR